MFSDNLQNIKQLMACNCQLQAICQDPGWEDRLSYDKGMENTNILWMNRTVSTHWNLERPFPTLLSKLLEHSNRTKTGDEATFSKLIIPHTYS